MTLLPHVPDPLMHWKTELEQLPAPLSEFEKWLFVSLASVLFGGKAGELLSLPAQQFNLSNSERLVRVTRLAEHWGLAQQVMFRSDTSTTVIIYRERAVREVLRQVSPCVLTCELGYTPDESPAVFLSEVARRWNERNAIPHEIGLALGYPIKDVLGFMGLLPLDCSGCCGWRIYGDPADSLVLSRNYAEANRHALRFLYA
jgi:hypothetical protein